MAKKHRAHNHDEGHVDETWLIPYADLLTLLLALFIVLFASSSIDAKKFDQIQVAFNSVLSGGTGIFEPSSVVPIADNSGNHAKKDANQKQPDTVSQKIQAKQPNTVSQKIQAKQETIELEKLKRQLDQYIKDNGLSLQLETKLNNSELMITIRDNALFPSGSATVKEEARKLAVSISKMLQQYPDYEIVVSGHTDDRPIHTAEFNSNWDLSSERAINFMKILLENKKVNPARFSAIGYGEYRPIDRSGTEQAQALNRRVEVSIIRKFQDDNSSDQIEVNSTP